MIDWGKGGGKVCGGYGVSWRLGEREGDGVVADLFFIGLGGVEFGGMD